VTAAQQGRTVLGAPALAGNTQAAPVSLAEQAKLAQMAMAGNTSIDPTQQAQFRASQMGLTQGLEGAIAGRDPSVAAIMLRQETERNIANQYAMAQAATGQNAGLAARQAAINSAGINQQSIGQQALLRAQEIATARGQLGGVLDSGRGQDIGLAGQQAGLSQQVNLANQSALNTGAQAQLGADVQTRLANAGFVNTASMNQAQLNQAIALANAGFKNTAMTTQAQLDAAQAQLNTQAVNQIAQANQQTSLAAGTQNATLAQQVALANSASQTNAQVQNANNALTAATSNAQFGTQVNLANAAQANQGAQFNAGNQLTAATTNATLGQQVNLANAAAQTGVSQTNAAAQTGVNTQNAQLAQQVALANAASTNQTNQTNATLGTQSNLANATNEVQTNAQNLTATNNLAQNALTGSGQAIQGAVGAASAQAEAQKAANQQDAAKLGALSTIGAALLSDRRAKTDITPGTLDVAAFLKDLKAYNFRYKDPDAPGAAAGERTGIMVQNLERNRLGRSLVRETPAGKAIDVNQATGAALAALAELNKRVEKVEAR